MSSAGSKTKFGSLFSVSPEISEGPYPRYTIRAFRATYAFRVFRALRAFPAYEFRNDGKTSSLLPHR